MNAYKSQDYSSSFKLDRSLYTTEYIERLLDEAPYPPTPVASRAKSFTGPAPISKTSGVYTLGELLDRPNSEVPLLIAPFLQRQGVAMLAGSSDTGKSSFLRQLALAVVLESPTFLDFPIHAVHHSAICVSTEDGDDAIGPLLKKQLSGQTIPDGARDRLRFVFNTDFLPVTLDKLLTQRPADVVIVDALGDLFDGNLNQSNEVRRFVAAYSALAIKHGCVILFMHHTGKRTEEQKPSKNNLLGSQGLEAKMRVVLELRLDTRNPQLRHLCILKGNYLPQELKNSSYVLRFDENLVFHNTSERRSFNELLKVAEDNKTSSNEDALWERARQHLDEGHSFERTATMLLPMAEQLRVKPLSKSAIARRFPKGDAQQPIIPSSQTQISGTMGCSSIPVEAIPSLTPFAFTDDQVNCLFINGGTATTQQLLTELQARYQGDPFELFTQLQHQYRIEPSPSGKDYWRIKTLPS